MIKVIDLENRLKESWGFNMKFEELLSQSNSLNDENVYSFLVEKLKDFVHEEVNNLSTQDSIKELVRLKGFQLIESEVKKNFPDVVLDEQEKQKVISKLFMHLFGLGPIEPLINDQTITEIMVNDYQNIYIEQHGILKRALDENETPIKFNTDHELRAVISKIVAPINRKVNESSPIVDGRLANGSRVNVVLNPISLDGSCLTIRKFPSNPYNLRELVKFKTLNSEIMNFLISMVKSKFNILVSGGTSSGKTTLLNALSMHIPKGERVVTIEDSAELKFNQVSNLIRLEARPSNVEGKGEILIRDLVKNSLRMRPDRIIVGEVRGSEALDMLQAMNTGHDGSLTTGHANSCLDMISRLETMVLMSGVELPVQSIRRQIASSIDVVIQLKKFPDGIRRVSEIALIKGIEESKVIMDSIFEYQEKLEGPNINRGFVLKNKSFFPTPKFVNAGFTSKEEVLTKWD